jgi:hypothetical protein
MREPLFPRVNTAPSTRTPQGQGPEGLLVNNTHVNIAYNIKKVGPSGVSKVEVYGTTDQGKTWKRLGVDADLHYRVEINLPGEGVYGIRMVGINGNGLGGKAPAAGDRPTTIIEVDLTGPKVQSWKIVPAKNGTLEIHWIASDKNLGPEPINLYYRTTANTPWKPMALKVKNAGIYQWPIIRDPAPQYFVRLEVIDRAGNVTTCETTNPTLVDRTEPDIHFQGVTVIQTRAEERTLVPRAEEPTLVPIESESEN